MLDLCVCCTCILQGVSLLELKCHLLLDYLINLVFLMLNKMQGQLIAGTSPIDRLIELRVVCLS